MNLTIRGISGNLGEKTANIFADDVSRKELLNVFKELGYEL